MYAHIADHIIRWLPGCLIFFLGACSQSAGHNPANTAAQSNSLLEQERIERSWDSLRSLARQVKDGDIVCRTGNDFTSETFRKMARRDQTYSHLGIAMRENDSIFIYHALGGEWNPDQLIRRDPLSVFAEPYNNKGAGLFRFANADEFIGNLKTQIEKARKDSVRFDMSFSLSSDDRMYCAEFVLKCIQWGSMEQIRFQPSRMGGIDYVAVDDIILHPVCRPITRIVYK